MGTDKITKREEILTKQLLLESAEKFFLEYGYQAAPLRKIASEAGFTHGALYGYFSSKEELFYALTDPMVEQLTDILDKIRNKMETLPKEKQLNGMGDIYYPNIPNIVDILISDRNAVKLIVDCAKGTKYEGFLDNIAMRNAESIRIAAENVEGKTVNSIEGQTMEVLMDGYIRTLFRLILSNKKRETIIQCMEMIGKIYEKGIMALMEEDVEDELR